MRSRLLHYAPKLLQSFWGSFSYLARGLCTNSKCVICFLSLSSLSSSLKFTFWNLHEPALEFQTHGPAFFSVLFLSLLLSLCFFLQHILSVPSANPTSHSNPNRSQVDLMHLDVRVHIHSSHTPKELKETLPGPVFVHWNKKANIDSVWTTSHSDESISDIL